MYLLFIVRKLLTALVLPLVLCGSLAIIGGIFKRRWLTLIAVAAIWMLSTRVASFYLMRPLEEWYPTVSRDGCPSADAIVVLSGGCAGRTSAGPQLCSEAAARFLGALQLAKAGKARFVVFTGAPLQGGMTGSQGEILREEAIANGISSDRILVTGRVLTTQDEADQVAHLPGIRSLILVTSAFHMPRSILLFNASGLKVYAYPTALRFPGGVSRDILSFVPNPASLEDSNFALHEYYALLYYRLTGRFGF